MSKGKKNKRKSKQLKDLSKCPITKEYLDNAIIEYTKKEDIILNSLNELDSKTLSSEELINRIIDQIAILEEEKENEEKIKDLYSVSADVCKTIFFIICISTLLFSMAFLGKVSYHSLSDLVQIGQETFVEILYIYNCLLSFVLFIISTKCVFRYLGHRNTATKIEDTNNAKKKHAQYKDVNDKVTKASKNIDKTNKVILKVNLVVYGILYIAMGITNGFGGSSLKIIVFFAFTTIVLWLVFAVASDVENWSSVSVFDAITIIISLISLGLTVISMTP